MSIVDFGEHLARAAERYQEARNAYEMENSGDSTEALSDAHRALASAIYEFRKRALSASPSPPAPEGNAVHRDTIPSDNQIAAEIGVDADEAVVQRARNAARKAVSERAAFNEWQAGRGDLFEDYAWAGWMARARLSAPAADPVPPASPAPEVVLSAAKALIDAAEATVMVNDLAPGGRGKIIVGFRVERSKVGVASLIEAFNEMVDLADATGRPASPSPQEVGEIVKWMRSWADHDDADIPEAEILNRFADAIERGEYRKESSDA